MKIKLQTDLYQEIKTRQQKIKTKQPQLFRQKYKHDQKKRTVLSQSKIIV